MKRMRNSTLSRSLFGLAALTLGCSAALCQTLSVGSLSGVLRTEDGKPVEGALVMAHARSLPKTAASSYSVRSQADGSFSISGLSKTRYEVCVHDRTQMLLDPCRWAASPPSADLTSVDSYRVPDIILKKGRLLQVRITDQTGVIAADKGAPKLLVGVWQDHGFFIPIPLKSTDAKGRIHALYVPGDESLQLSVTSNAYELTDENGKQADRKKAFSKQVLPTPANTPITVSFRATGGTQ